jgi:signal transduction histidine kinase
MSVRAKIAVLLIGLTLLTATLIGAAGYVALRARLLEAGLNEGQIGVTEEISRLQLLLHGVREDALVLASSDNLLDYVDALGSDGAADLLAQLRIERTFEDLARTEPRFLQIRYLDLAGRERVRLNAKQGQVPIAPTAALQDKSREPYFKYIEELRRGSVYVSRLDLNRDQGGIEGPQQPTIRFVTPVFDREGRRRGGIVIILDGRLFLTGGAEGENHVLLIDSDGYFLQHRDREVTFGFDLGPGHDVAHLAPALAERLKRQPSGAFLSDPCTYTEGPCATAYDRVRFDARPDAWWTVARERPVAAILAPLRAQTTSFVLATLVAAVMAGLCGYVGALLMTRPVNALVRAAERIRAGDLDVSVAARGSDEFTVMASAFNQMIASLKASIESDRSLLQREREARAALAATAAELTRSNHDLEQFAYVASHDLKAPLRGIVQLAGWIEQDLGTNLQGEPMANLHRLRGRALRLEDLLTNLLDYARATRTDQASEQVDTGAVLDEVVDLLQLPSGVTVAVAGDLPTVSAPRGVLHHILGNLIGNAIKHRDRDQVGIRVAARDLGEAHEFEVEDDGPGIPPEFYGRIFKIFKTLRPRDELEGSGIGLAIVRRLLEVHGGRVTVSSTAGQRGTTFRFTWPKPGRYRQAA